MVVKEEDPDSHFCNIGMAGTATVICRTMAGIDGRRPCLCHLAMSSSA